VSVARRACWSAGAIYLAVGMLPVLIGLSGAHLSAPGAEGDNFLPALVRHIAHPMMFLIFSGALLSAILSTVDSNILSTSSLVSVNLLAGLHARASERMRLAIARGVTVGASFFAFLIAAGGASIRELITLTSVLGQAGLLVAVLIGIYSRFGSERAALGAVIACALTNIATLAVWPIERMLAEGSTLAAAFAALFAGEAPSYDGYFLFSVLAALIGYVAVAIWERRVALPQL
jgi:Na+/proline symporter